MNEEDVALCRNEFDVVQIVLLVHCIHVNVKAVVVGGSGGVVVMTTLR
jgi:hypothetical protein